MLQSFSYAVFLFCFQQKNNNGPEFKNQTPEGTNYQVRPKALTIPENVAHGWCAVVEGQPPLPRFSSLVLWSFFFVWTCAQSSTCIILTSMRFAFSNRPRVLPLTPLGLLLSPCVVFFALINLFLCDPSTRSFPFPIVASFVISSTSSRFKVGPCPCFYFFPGDSKLQVLSFSGFRFNPRLWKVVSTCEIILVEARLILSPNGFGI